MSMSTLPSFQYAVPASSCISPDLQKTVPTDLHNNVETPLTLSLWKQTVLHGLVKRSQLVSLQLLCSLSTMAGQILGLLFIFLPPFAMLVLAFVYHLVIAITFSQLLRTHLVVC